MLWLDNVSNDNIKLLSTLIDLLSCFHRCTEIYQPKMKYFGRFIVQNPTKNI